MRFLLATTLLLAGCATPPPTIVVQPLAAREVTRVHPQDVRFARVDIESVPILAAVESLSSAIREVYGDRFGFSTAYTAGPFPGTPEGRVTYHGSDVSLHQLLEEFCRQTHWNYTWVSRGFIEFRNGPFPGYRPEIRRPRPNQALQPTADRRISLHMTSSTLKIAAQLAPASGG